MTITAHPLRWPAGWKRTEQGYIEISRFRDRTIAKARIYVADQVRLMGGESLVVSSNIELRNDGLPRSGQKQPVDRGVAVYFIRKGRSMCFACDKWAFVEDNLWAIGRTVDALRQIERDGSSDMLERAFAGFAALPAPGVRHWWDVLGVPAFASTEQIKAAFRDLAKIHHPGAEGCTMTEQTQTTAQRIQDMLDMNFNFYPGPPGVTAKTIAAEIDRLTAERDAARAWKPALDEAVEALTVARAEVERLRPAAEAWEAQAVYDSLTGYEPNLPDIWQKRQAAAARARAAKGEK